LGAGGREQRRKEEGKKKEGKKKSEGRGPPDFDFQSSAAQNLYFI